MAWGSVEEKIAGNTTRSVLFPEIHDLLTDVLVNVITIYSRFGTRSACDVVLCGFPVVL